MKKTNWKPCYSIGYDIQLKYGKSHVIIKHLNSFKDAAEAQFDYWANKKIAERPELAGKLKLIAVGSAPE